MLLAHYDDNSYLIVNWKEIYEFEANNKNINFPTQFRLGSINHADIKMLLRNLTY